MSDWLWKTATNLGRGIEAGEIDPVALAEAYLDAIEGHEAGERIYARTTRDRAMAEAGAARSRAKHGLRRSILDGVPISWKDLVDSTGTATEAGTRLMQGRVPEKDAVVLRNATEAGLVCLGKTHLSEIAFSGLGYNPMTATPPNVHDPDRVPGGSSSGAAASVAFGLAAAGIGSDTGGSVRLPAAWNDLVGLKTTHGRLSIEGVVPLAASFDSIGPLCRSVEDAAHLFAAMAATRAPDMEGADLSNARFLRLDTVALDDLDDQPRAAFENAVDRLRAAGAIVETVSFPDLHAAFELAGILYTSDAWSAWQDRIETAPEKMFVEIYDRIRVGSEHKASDYIKAWRDLSEIRVKFNSLVAGCDAVLTPTVASMPPEVSRIAAESDIYVSENLKALRNTRIGNLMGLCGVTLPTGVPSCGILLNGAAGRDEAILRMAKAAERALS